MPAKVDQGRSLVCQPEPDTPHFAGILAAPIDGSVWLEALIDTLSIEPLDRLSTSRATCGASALKNATSAFSMASRSVSKYLSELASPEKGLLALAAGPSSFFTVGAGLPFGLPA